MFTIKTESGMTTELKTYSCYLQQNTADTTDQKTNTNKGEIEMAKTPERMDNMPAKKLTVGSLFAGI
jgi:hypothetical protein